MEKINLVEILKDCPRGTKFYSPLFGEVEFDRIDNGDVYPIVIISNRGRSECFSTKGKYYTAYDEAECMLFPSKDQRDWSKFTAPWYKKDRFDPKTLKPFDRVIVRNHNGEWGCATFSHIKYYDSCYRYDCCYMIYRYCIPFNDDTKHLVGTTEEAPEYYRWWE